MRYILEKGERRAPLLLDYGVEYYVYELQRAVVDLKHHSHFT